MILLAVGSTFAACKKSDKERPTVTILSPADSTIFETGQNIPFSATFLDNENLGQYKINIHNNFDGHVNDKYLATVWNQILIQNINGTSLNENRSIVVPDSAAAGWYHLVVNAVDDVGNQSYVSLRNIYIRNITDTVAPSVVLSTPSQNAILTLGVPISINASLADDERVFVVNTRIRKPNATTNIFLKADTFGTNQVEYNKIIPTNTSAWTAGNYELTFTVFDNYYNQRATTVIFSLN